MRRVYIYIPGAPKADGCPNDVEPNPVFWGFVLVPKAAGAEVVVFPPRNEKFPKPPA